MELADSSWVNTIDEGETYYFDCAMISTFAPVFDQCEDNYDVESVLRNAKVIRTNNRTDTESCSLVVLFSSRSAGENFINRLNTYLQTWKPKKSKKLNW